MRGIVGFEHFKIRCIIGVYPNERSEEQDIFIDLRVRTDFSHCVKSEKLQDTVDYTVLANLLTELAQTGRFMLMETLAHEALSKIMLNPGVEWAWIRIKKPKALPGAQHGFVELERSK